MSLQPKSFAEAKAKFKPLSRAKPLRASSPMSRSKKPLTSSKRGNKPRRLGARPLRKSRNRKAEMKWMREVREKDNNTCRLCGGFDLKLDTHHIAPRSLRPDLKRVVENGAALHRHCHEWVHNNREEATALGLLNMETYELAQKQIQGD